ncbi:tRNA (guanine-N-7) methyltransferase [Penicillium sp. DV-2018c]|nr:tRNA (guanine-N-7) methyltransferase [Penicillium sp. DV-2018c]
MGDNPPAKRIKREEYRRNVQAQQEASDGSVIKMPQKKFFRQRAHANPFSDHKLNYPISPAHMDWSSHFPAFVDPDESKKTLSGGRKLTKEVEVVDIGCGFGGLMVGLAPLLPDTLMVGMEIRISVLEYLSSRIHALRNQQLRLKTKSAIPPTTEIETTTPAQSSESASADPPSSTPANDDEIGTDKLFPGNFENITAIRSNTMKFLPNFFARHQLSKIFICFPDPHFKARKHKARIVSETLNSEYAYVLRPGGLLYTITDVEEYHHWVLRHFLHGELEDGSMPPGSSKDLFERVSEEELDADPCVRVMKFETEESKKVTRNKGNKYVAVFRRKADPEWPV